MGKCGRKCVGAPHPNTLPYTSPIPLPTSFPHTPTHFPTHPIHSPAPLPHFFTPHTSFVTSQHTSLHLPPHTHTTFHSSPHLPLHPNTLTPTPQALFHTSPHSFDYEAKLPCDDYLNKFNWTVEKPDKIFYDNRGFKVLFWCGQCKFSMYDSVAKLPCGEVTGNRSNEIRLFTGLRNFQFMIMFDQQLCKSIKKVPNLIGFMLFSIALRFIFTVHV